MSLAYLEIVLFISVIHFYDEVAVKASDDSSRQIMFVQAKVHSIDQRNATSVSSKASLC